MGCSKTELAPTSQSGLWQQCIPICIQDSTLKPPTLCYMYYKTTSASIRDSILLRTEDLTKGFRCYWYSWYQYLLVSISYLGTWGQNFHQLLLLFLIGLVMWGCPPDHPSKYSMPTTSMLKVGLFQLCFCFEDAYNSPKSPPTHQNLFQLFNTCIWQAPKTSSSHHQQQLRERLAHAAHILRSLRKTHSLY